MGRRPLVGAPGVGAEAVHEAVGQTPSAVQGGARLRGAPAGPGGGRIERRGQHARLGRLGEARVEEEEGQAALGAAPAVGARRLKRAGFGPLARANHAALNALPSAFLSTSLSAAGVEQPDHVGLDDFVRTFETETLWTPRLLHHAGGAIRPSSYDYFKRLAVTLIARSRGEDTGDGGDYDLTERAREMRRKAWRNDLTFCVRGIGLGMMGMAQEKLVLSNQYNQIPKDRLPFLLPTADIL